MASGAVSPLVQYLLRLLDEEIDLLGGARNDVDSLKRQLRIINTFLEKSEGKQNDETEKEVVRQIRELAFKIEDVIDGYILRAAQFRRRHVLVQIISIDHLFVLHGVGKEIKGLEKEIKKIMDHRRAFGIERAEASVDLAAPNVALRRRRRDVEEHDVVGFFGHSATLVKHLTEGNSKIDVISIIGMGGLGKTTLAKKIYNSDSVKSHFECRSWVCVSQDFRAKELLLETLTSHMPISDRIKLRKKIEDMSDDELENQYLVELLFKYLQGKRYLVVMDDVWSTDVWNEVRLAFPDDSNGSRILITSRNKRVAPSYASLNPPYHLPCLNQDESWELLRKKVFGSGTYSPELEDPGREMVEGCRGLPLSIVALASFLAEKEKTYQIWRQLVPYVNGNSNIENTNICKDSLALSYIHLRRELKLCFLYLGVYPKDYDIPVWQLIQLWIAEGFIQRTEGRKIEDIAEFDYLDELIGQNLIQVVSKRTDGRRKICRIPDLLRDICISECNKEKFLEVFEDVNISSTNESRRLSFLGSTLGCISSKCARSLLFFGQDTFNFDPNHWKWVLKHLKLVRVLNFGKVNLYSVPTEIGELILLRYLRIESQKLNLIPASICSLTNLETLDMRGTFLNRLPNGIWKLSSLRNLYMSGPVSLPNNFNSDVEALWKLQVLSTVSLNPQNVGLILEAKLLRKLGIWFVSDEGECGTAKVLASLHNHKSANLQTLKIINCSEGYRLPISFPMTIIKITLRKVKLRSRQDMRVLGTLPILEILKLDTCLLSSTLHVFAGSFPKLQVLKLEKLSIKKWRQKRGAMPFLKHLVIKRCSELTMLPSKLWNLTALQDVEVLWSSSESELMLQELEKSLGFKLVIEKLP